MVRCFTALLVAGCSVATPPAPPAPDLSLSDLKASECVALGAPVEVQLRVVVRGMEGRELELAIAIATRDGQAVATEKQVARVPGPGTHACAFTVKSPPVGEYRLTVTAPAQAEEPDVDNNVASAPFSVRPREPRVLYLEHPPRYEYRFLKNALMRDRSLLAHAFLTSAEEGFPQECSRASGDPRFKEPLKAVPRTLQELLGYDVVVLGDVDAERLPVEALRAFVEDHGRGLVVIAGVMNAPRGWKGTALARLIPVEPAADALDDNAAPLSYRLTDAGVASAITRFPSHANDPAANREQWEDRDSRGDGLVGVRWTAKVKAKAGAEVLVEAGVPPAWTPLFVTGRAGRGRVFFSATDETWLWRYLVGDEPWFYAFWRNAISWAAGE